MSEQVKAYADETEGPKRRYSGELRFGADTFEDLLHIFEELLFDLGNLSESEREVDYKSITGGPSAGWSVAVRVDTAMGHDRYMEAIHEWVAARKAGGDGA